MRFTTLALLLFAAPVYGQMGRSLDWTTLGGDAQRSGWEKTDTKFRYEDVPTGFRFLWKLKPEGGRPGRQLMPPVIIGNLIGYRGFKELAFIPTSDDSIYVMDSDMNRMYWQRHVREDAQASGCATTMPAPTLMALAFRRPVPRGDKKGGPAARPALPPGLSGIRVYYVISSDGKLHLINVANGEEVNTPVEVLPPNAQASTLNIVDGVLYTTTGNACGRPAPAAVWAIDVSGPDPKNPPKVTSFVSRGGQFIGQAGPVVSGDGAVYVATGEGASNPSSETFSNAVVALTAKTLKVKGYYNVAASASPLPFSFKGKELVAAAGMDGKLYLLDESSFSDHKSPVAQAAAPGVWGLSSWEQTDGTRWLLAAMWGSGHGSITAFKIEEEGGKPTLKQAWTSREMVRPVPPIIANGVVFALSGGERQTPATLYALDAMTGKELWSSGKQVTAPANGTGLAIANGRVYFATSDGTLWVFGMPLEI